ncbi:D-Ala-D-Ala carboxypeptidase family metallohydrolase [Limnobacter sp.]|uniref:D-Ala-D-Ala carboxypeptidase family metallohydrolase n=1 Tax=Limnobacter sp. TaxID=2003368 RepID=UPI003512C694
MGGLALWFSAKPVSAAPTPIWLDLQRNKQRLRVNIAEQSGVNAAAWLLRDIRANNTVGRPDWQLLVRMAALQELIAQHHRYCVFDITSGLRTHGTNALTEGAAHHSNHLPDAHNRFCAVDFKPLGLPLDTLHSLANRLPNVGLGLYDSHVHLDHRLRPARW